MKTIKEWKDGEFHVKIKAEFIIKGAQSYYSALSYKPMDCVKIVATVSDGSRTASFENTVTADKYFYRVGLLRRKKFKTFRESYEIDLERLEERVLQFIEDKRKKKDIEKYGKEITDGLPDSLDGM